MGSLNMNITTATVSDVPSILGEPYERRPILFFGICNLIAESRYSGGFLGSLKTNITTEKVSEVPSVQGGPYKRRPLEFFGICNIISRISILERFWGR